MLLSLLLLFLWHWRLKMIVCPFVGRHRVQKLVCLTIWRQFGDLARAFLDILVPALWTFLWVHSNVRNLLWMLWSVLCVCMCIQYIYVYVYVCGCTCKLHFGAFHDKKKCTALYHNCWPSYILRNYAGCPSNLVTMTPDELFERFSLNLPILFLDRKLGTWAIKLTKCLSLFWVVFLLRIWVV